MGVSCTSDQELSLNAIGYRRLAGFSGLALEDYEGREVAAVRSHSQHDSDALFLFATTLDANLLLPTIYSIIAR